MKSIPEIKKNQNTGKNKPLNSLLELNILGYKYKYKDTYSTGYCYRCIYRIKC